MTIQVFKRHNPKEEMKEALREIVSHLKGDDKELVNALCQFINDSEIEIDDIIDEDLFDAVYNKLKCDAEDRHYDDLSYEVMGY